MVKFTRPARYTRICLVNTAAGWRLRIARGNAAA
jgi:hypothetical protein